MIKRWVIMTLVALLVLGTMGAALANEEAAELEEPAAAVDPGFETDTVTWLSDVVTFVFFWGGFAETDALAECPTDEVVVETMFGTVVLTEAMPCVPLDVTGPQGQVNHGTMVSAFVHALKDGKVLLEGYEDMPKGQMVKELAHLDFGKGLDGDELEDEEPGLAEEDGHGPPDHVIAKKAEKVNGKKK
jgi:hypothetical protein